MRYQSMTTVADLRNWVDSVTSNWWERTDAQVAELVQVIRSLPDCPNWGADWSEFLDALPELSELLPE